MANARAVLRQRTAVTDTAVGNYCRRPACDDARGWEWMVLGWQRRVRLACVGAEGRPRRSVPGLQSCMIVADESDCPVLLPVAELQTPVRERRGSLATRMLPVRPVVGGLQNLVL